MDISQTKLLEDMQEKFYKNKCYKYRHIGEIDSLQRTWIKQILIENVCYFANPTSLNDPYDCNPIAKLPPAKDLRKYTKNILKSEHSIKVSESDLTKSVVDLQQFQDKQAYVQNLLDTYLAVFCLSKTPTSPLQWAYYGDSHKGICLEFDLAKINDWVGVEVEYTEKRPVVELVRIRQDKEYQKKCTFELVYQKSKEWEREQEVRIVKPSKGLYKFPPSALTSVVFGMGATDKSIEFIMNILQSSSCRPEIKICKQVNDTYEINIEKYIF